MALGESGTVHAVRHGRCLHELTAGLKLRRQEKILGRHLVMGGGREFPVLAMTAGDAVGDTVGEPLRGIHVLGFCKVFFELRLSGGAVDRGG